MAQWYHLFSLLSVMCMSFGALYLVFNSDFNDVCDYTGVIDSCNELKTYSDKEMSWELQSMRQEWVLQAQAFRNASEIQKCQIEETLLTNLRNREKVEAERILAKCHSDFKACVVSGYTTTTPPPTQTDCTTCNKFCRVTKWTDTDPAYAASMGYTGVCTKTVCPWAPECGDGGQFTHAKCSARGCSCDKLQCASTTTATPVATTTSSLGSTTTSTSTTSSLGTTTTSTTTTTTTTTFVFTTTTVSTTSGTTTLTTTVTTTTTTTSTTTTSTTTSTTTTSTSTTTTSTTSTSTVGCMCPPGVAGTVMVGPPHKTWYGSTTLESAAYWQGVIIETHAAMPAGGSGELKDCRFYFSNRSTYAGPRNITSPSARANARNSHFGQIGLGCGYSGSFAIKCETTGVGTCGLTVDISTCVPPTYSTALTECYSTTTTTTMTYVQGVSVQDFLGIEVLNFTSLASLPPDNAITTQTTTPYPCCSVHVGSVCRTDIPDFTFPTATIQGRWNPKASYNGKGYFPVTPCDRQPKSQPRACERVRLREIDQGYRQWAASCGHTCNLAKAQAELKKICNRTAHPVIEQMEKAAHNQKIASMQAQKAGLESWTAGRMPTVTESKQVVDCFADRLPSRFNSLALPKMRSGFEKMPLHNQCRMHGCKATQCLEIKKTCRIPWVHEAPEQQCNVYRPNGTFQCVEKIGIMTNNPMSLGFGIAWMVIGSIFCCAGIASFVRTLSSEGGFSRQVDQA